MQNYEVTIAEFGKHYRFGNVIPESVPLAYGNNPAKLVEQGVLKPTNLEVNCRIVAPELPTITDGQKEGIVERNALLDRAENAELNAKLLGAKVGEQETLLAARMREIQRLIDENGQLRSANSDHQAGRDAAEKTIAELQSQVASLTNDLNVATAPKSPKHPKQPVVNATTQTSAA